MASAYWLTDLASCGAIGFFFFYFFYKIMTIVEAATVAGK